MHYPEVDTAHRVGIVIEQGDDLVLVLFRQDQFLLDLAGDGGMVGIRAGFSTAGVHRVHMAAHAHGNFGMQSAFSARFSPRVMQDTPTAAEHAVGNQLLVARVVFSRGAVHEKVVRRVQQPCHGLTQVCRSNAFEGPYFIKKRPRDHQHLFSCILRHARNIPTPPLPPSPQIHLTGDISQNPLAQSPAPR